MAHDLWGESPLKLKVNREKSAVARPWKRSFLGFSFLKIWGRMRISVPEKSWTRLREKVKALFRPGRGRNLERFIREYLNPLLRGWLQYFGMRAGKKDLPRHDFWIRRRLRDLIWRQSGEKACWHYARTR